MKAASAPVIISLLINLLLFNNCAITSIKIVNDKIKPETAFINTRFENMNWGMTENEVKAIDREAKEGNFYKGLRSYGLMWGFDVDILYSFLDGKLESCDIYFLFDNFDAEKCIVDYKKIKYILIDIFGSPEIVREPDNVAGFAYEYRESYDEISFRKNSYMSVWYIGNTKIELNLFGLKDCKFLNLEYKLSSY